LRTMAKARGMSINRLIERTRHGRRAMEPVDPARPASPYYLSWIALFTSRAR
jgi:hypothetical protein